MKFNQFCSNTFGYSIKSLCAMSIDCYERLTGRKYSRRCTDLIHIDLYKVFRSGHDAAGIIEHIQDIIDDYTSFYNLDLDPDMSF